jgi:hypothetical protein
VLGKRCPSNGVVLFDDGGGAEATAADVTCVLLVANEAGQTTVRVTGENSSGQTIAVERVVAVAAVGFTFTPASSWFRDLEAALGLLKVDDVREIGTAAERDAENVRFCAWSFALH